MANAATSCREIMAGLLIEGPSLIGTEAAELTAAENYSVVCTLEIQNYTKWPMVDPIVYNHQGWLKTLPVDVLPGHREALVSHKNGWTATGIFGTVSWQMQNPDTVERVLVMWCCPYNYQIWANELAVSIIESDEHDDAEGLTTKLYRTPLEKWNKLRMHLRRLKESKLRDYDKVLMEMDRRGYSGKKKTLTDVRSGGRTVIVEGVMGSHWKTEAKISVFPNFYEDLAPDIIAVVDENDYKNVLPYCVDY